MVGRDDPDSRPSARTMSTAPVKAPEPLALSHFAAGLAVVARHEDREALSSEELERLDCFESVAGVVLGVAAQTRELGQRIHDENTGSEPAAGLRRSLDDLGPRRPSRVGPGEKEEVVTVIEPRSHEGGSETRGRLLGQHHHRARHGWVSQEWLAIEDGSNHG